MQPIVFKVPLNDYQVILMFVYAFTPLFLTFRKYMVVRIWNVSSDKNIERPLSTMVMAIDLTM